jgi:pyruvate/2-oxoglutarate dehydrogenase complex dihydrolipoamide acyltransferase (E2) component
MMMLPVLAADWIEMVVVSIGIVIYIGNMIAKGIRGEQSTDNEDAQAQRQAKLQAIAAQRREHLQQMAQQRSGKQEGGASTQNNPQTIYERRAQAIARARENQGQSRSPGGTGLVPSQTDQKLAQARAQAASRQQQQALAQAQAQYCDR